MWSHGLLNDEIEHCRVRPFELNRGVWHWRPFFGYGPIWECCAAEAGTNIFGIGFIIATS
jgi:hypothetical protein